MSSYSTGASARGGAGGRGRGHQPGSSMGGSINSRKAELTSAYASLAAELTRKELKTVGGYTIGRVIGEGSFGKVHIGVHRLTNTRVAIKQVPKSLPFTSDPSSPLSLLTREIHHHRRLRHPHVLALYEIIATESSIYLITELCTGGELFDYLVEKGRLSLSETKRIFGQLVLGVGHLHQSGVVHRDLKLENVLLDERINVKIADLGFGREFEKGRWMETWVGTLGYCAPEVVAAKRYLGEEVDIWSLGVILFTLLTGSLPFDDDDEGIMKEKILKCEYDVPTWLDEDAIDLIDQILQLDPFKRLTLKAILSHRFFNQPTRPPPQPLFDPSSSTSSTNSTSNNHLLIHSSHDLPPVIPEQEESDSPQMMDRSRSTSPPLEKKPERSHQGTSSDVSDTSFFDSEVGSRSGATTPITSEDDSTSEVKRGKRKAAETGESMGLSHRNESQATLRTEVEPTPKHTNGHTNGRGRSILPTNREEEEEPVPPSPLINSYQSVLGLSAPPLSRNVSSSSSVSNLSAGGSPIPVHTRTPSRTKRHSVGSMFSERLFSLDEEPPTIHIDYLALLAEPVPEPLSSPEAKILLESLKALGFDVGQIAHSIATDACDSSGAIWWMLKRKKDESEREENELKALIKSVGASGSNRTTSSKYGGSRSRGVNGSAVHTSDSEAEVDADARKEEKVIAPEMEDTPTTTTDLDVDDDQMETPPLPTPRPNPNHHAADSQLGEYFLGSHSAPLLPYFPTVDPGSPSRSMARSKSKDALTSFTGPPHLGSPLEQPISLPGSPGSIEGSGEGKEFKAKRARSSSASMLARATSAIGSSLALKKASEEAPKGSEEGRTTPLAGLFARKASIPDETVATPRQLSPPASPQRPPVPIDLPSTPKALSTTPKGTPPTIVTTPSIASSASQDTFDTVTSTSSAARRIPTFSNMPVGKKSSKGNLFSNFKLWFGDAERRKRKRTSAHIDPSSMTRSTSLNRSGSISRRTLRPDGTYVGSPLKKPPLGSRRSSTASLAPPSRRSSMTSVHRVKKVDPGSSVSSPLHPRPRRRSDASRTSNSDREHSRPPSIRSMSGNDNSRRTHHAKSGSVSSVGSIRPNTPSKETYRRPPTTTTVRRRHGSAGRHGHTRNRSTGSSIHTRRSSASSSDDEELADEQKNAAPILEEDETGGEEDRMGEERQRALRKLSGEFPLAAEIHAVPSRVSMDSQRSSDRERHSPTVFAAHKTRHVFGAPSQPTPSSVGRRPSHSTSRPALRDVFKAKDSDGEWIDESDDFGGYGGGLGQGSTRIDQRSDVSASANAPAGTQSDLNASDSGVGADTGISKFEGRYAGVMGSQKPDAGATSWKSGQASRPAFRSAIVIEEEEEED